MSTKNSQSPITDSQPSRRGEALDRVMRAEVADQLNCNAWEQVIAPMKDGEYSRDITVNLSRSQVDDLRALIGLDEIDVQFSPETEFAYAITKHIAELKARAGL